MERFLGKLEKLISGQARFAALLEQLGRGASTSARAIEVGLDEPLMPAFTAVLHANLGGPVLVVAPGAEYADIFADDLAVFLGAGERAHRFPSRGLVIAGEEGEDPESVALRHRGLRELRQPRETGNAAPLLVADLRALLQPQPLALAETPPLVLETGRQYDLESLERELAALGYRREYMTEGMGQFSVRGGILDLYNPVEQMPVRAEFAGDVLERLARFNPVTQRSLERLKGATVYAVSLDGAKEPDGGYAALTSFVPPEGLTLVLEPQLCRERAEGWSEPELLEFDTALNQALAPVIFGDPLSADAGFRCERPRAYRGRLEDLIEDLRDLTAKRYRVGLFLETEGRLERLREILAEAEIPLVLGGGGITPGVVHLALGSPSAGLLLPRERLAVLTESEVFGRVERRRAGRETTSGRPIESYQDLEPGDYVVHVNHGIGIYGGLTQKSLDGSTREYLTINYAEGDALYVPTDRIELVHRYVGAEKPPVYRLTGSHWRQVKRRARVAVQQMAGELLELYAERMAAEGWAFSPDGPWQQEMEASFPYQETPDQAGAIDDVKSDMEQPVPMDRLVYGDVGYGKTEVAIRAAFKAVMDGKQVAVLVPTTVLAQQHYHTFVSRFAPFPIRVEVLSRFLKPREQKTIIEELSLGKVDVVVGTHRLFQADVVIPELALIVVDEEHRFGVAHKERLKAMRRTVDVLTLTATPIPRTLQMSLSGIRDMSIIDTPIQDRYSVIVSVGPYEKQVVQEAVRRELARDGQVFYVHNRVQTIDAVARRLQKLVPEARVSIGHGQMDEGRLARVMDGFVAHEFDVLVCTTIVESGLDIPNVNTLIVEGAEILGLSQLYHLRGRIGRSHRQAYAFFFFTHGNLTEGAYRRLKVIRDFSELGSGFRIAMKDLEIRGAGNLLGPEQHGHVEAVGFELYNRLLAEAVDRLRGVKRFRVSEASIDLPLPAFIPVAYVSSASRRVEIYRRISEAADNAGLADLEAEIADRYGAEPPEVLGLFGAAALRLLCLKLGLREVGRASDAPDTVVLKLREKAEERAAALRDILDPLRAGTVADFGYNTALHELTIQFPRGSWRAHGLRQLELLTGWLDDIVKAESEAVTKGADPVVT